MRYTFCPTLLVALFLLLPSCARVTIDPIEVKPIHMTLDVNLKIDRELDQFFAFENKYAPATTQSTTQPTTQTAASSASPGGVRSPS
jgi:hypothetical protein